MAHRRVRQHVNPLSLRYVRPRAERIHVPSHLGLACEVDVELGCADAKFSFDLARRHPERFVVGLDIREKMLALNRRRAASVGLRNLVFGYVNLSVDADRVFAPQSVDRFHLLFPDPWFKARHHKRRVIEESLWATLRRQLRDGGELHIATDVFEIALEAMFELEHPEARALGYVNLAGAWSFWRGNPFHASSRREDTTHRRQQRVWRIRYGVQSGPRA
jgi:tRNA (guanine-N7-)-methyltransferase